MNTPTLQLQVKRVIGTGDPMDALLLIPLISQWGVPKECIYNVKEECTAPLHRLYVLEEPLVGFGNTPTGFSVVGACEAHHQLLVGKEGSTP